MFKIENIVIFAAGRGKRMGELCDNCPKPLLKISEKPIIEKLVEYFRSKTLCKITIVVGYLNYRFNYLSDKYENIQLINNNIWSETNNTSSLIAAIHNLKNSLIINGDVLIKSDCVPLEYETSCTFAEINENINEWSIELDDNGSILDFNMNPNDYKGLYQREITIISSELAECIKKEKNTFDLSKYYEFQVLNVAKKYNIPFKPFVVEKEQVYDLDNVKKYNEEI